MTRSFLFFLLAFSLIISSKRALASTNAQASQMDLIRENFLRITNVDIFEGAEIHSVFLKGDNCEIYLQTNFRGFGFNIKANASGKSHSQYVPVMLDQKCTADKFEGSGIVRCLYNAAAPTDETPIWREYKIEFTDRTITLNGVSCAFK